MIEIIGERRTKIILNTNKYSEAGIGSSALETLKLDKYIVSGRE